MISSRLRLNPFRSNSSLLSTPISASNLLRGASRASASRYYASIPDSSLEEVLDHNQSQSQGLSPAQRAAQANAAPQLSKAVVEMKRERKLAQYANTLKVKALQEGYSSVEEFKQAKLDQLAKLKAETQEAQSQARAAAASSASTDATSSSTSSLESETVSETLEERDSRVMGEIRRRAEKEAKRKLESGQLGSGPGGKSPVKPLSEILDISKFASESSTKITELWTGYHTMKNKLSAVIPADTYRSLVSNAQRYPQFVLPLGRKVIDGDEKESKNLTEEQIKEKQGFEMQFLEWAFLPIPPTVQIPESSKSISPRIPKPSTVLFTPLAEYKLRQTFAQPLLILTHYVDLIESHGIVLMRGDITGSDDDHSSPPSSTLAIQEAINQGKSQEEIEELQKPIQSQGRIGMKEAQILTMMLQRFYVDSLSGMDKLKEKSESGKVMGVGNDEIRGKLLKDFHEDPGSFDVEVLIKAAYML